MKKKRTEFQIFLKAMIRSCGMSQREFAKELGFDVSYINHLLKGRRLPSVNFTNAICLKHSGGKDFTRAIHLAAARAHGWDL